MTDGHDFPRVERLDASNVAEQLRRQTGIDLTVDGPCRGGQVGAAYVRWPNGRRAVLTWRPDTRLADLQAGPLAVVETLRSIGYPAPATELAAQVGDGVAVVQELLPGTPSDRVDHALVDQALALNARQEAALAASPAVPRLSLHLRRDGPGFCLHQPLRSHSPGAAALEDWITEVGASHPEQMDGDDAVHMDFHAGNILAVDGTLSGVVDWDGACRGDRRFDLVTFRFGIHATGAEPGVAERLDEILDSIPPATLRPMWAHMSLRMTDWAIRHFGAADVDVWLELARQRID